MSVKPRFRVKPTNTTVIEGGFLLLHCVAVGDPTPTVNWDKNNRVDDGLDPNRFKVSFSLSLLTVISTEEFHGVILKIVQSRKSMACQQGETPPNW